MSIIRFVVLICLTYLFAGSRAAAHGEDVAVNVTLPSALTVALSINAWTVLG